MLANQTTRCIRPDAFAGKPRSYRSRTHRTFVGAGLLANQTTRCIRPDAFAGKPRSYRSRTHRALVGAKLAREPDDTDFLEGRLRGRASLLQGIGVCRRLRPPWPSTLCATPPAASRCLADQAVAVLLRQPCSLPCDGSAGSLAKSCASLEGYFEKKILPTAKRKIVVFLLLGKFTG